MEIIVFKKEDFRKWLNLRGLGSLNPNPLFSIVF
jgi:hypothetical protein